MMEWWQTFFDDQYLKLYGEVLPAERTEREVKGVLGILGLPQGAKVLDLCCGQGRHSIRLAQTGLRVTGLDLSPHLLAVARRDAEVAGVKLTLVEGDMRQIPFRGTFDAIVNLFTAFGYFDTDAENAKVLRCVARALKPGGQFLIELPNVYFTRALSTLRTWRESEVGPLLHDVTFDPWTGRDTTTFIWYESGERKTRFFNVRTYAPHEVIAMLHAARLTPVKLYGGFDMSDYHYRDSRRLIVLAKKEG
jgi:SAM-dependent methyltransferase